MISWMVWILFFLSGACGLVYEVLWTRHLGLIFGNTVHSLSAVLAAFMGGLALGSYYAGRHLARGRRLLLTYGLLELFIGLYCLALPHLLQLSGGVLGPLYDERGGGMLPVVRFVIAAILLLAPTACMGATLPLLSQFMLRRSQGFSRAAGMLYAINTLGAVAGAAGTGFFLLPTLGRSATNSLAVLGNLLLGSVAIYLGSRPEARESDEPAPPASSGKAAHAAPAPVVDPIPAGTGVRAATWAFGLTGFAAMATQIGWTRALSLSLGSSTYAFSLIVSIFILGLALGGAWGARMAAQLSDPLGTLAKVLVSIGLLALSVSTLLGFGPVFFFWLMALGSQRGFGVMLAMEAMGVGLLLLAPTFLMGATLPLVLQVASKQATGPGGAARVVGRMYAVNTAGSILGSLAGGLILLPLLQIQNTLIAMALLYALAGGVLFRFSASWAKKRERILFGVLAALCVGCFFLPGWDPLRMSSGTYLLHQRDALEAVRQGHLLEGLPGISGRKLEYYREGAAASVAVFRTAEGLTLSIGGKPDASSRQDMSTQVGLTLIPELLHPTGARQVLVIGMGSGVSVGAGLSPASVEHLDLVEISPEVVEASWHFREVNGLTYADLSTLSPLAEPRVSVIVNDGRNHLELTRRRYDVIASEPSNPWIAGIGNLFTREAFELYRSRLEPGGILSQWIHRYGMAEQEFKSVCYTFSQVFPHWQLWCVLPGTDYVLLGSMDPIRPKLPELEARMREPRVAEYLRRVPFHRSELLFSSFMADGPALAARLVGSPLHTDDNLLLEFAAPRTLYQGNAQFSIAGWRVSAERILDLSGPAGPERREYLRRLDLAVAARQCFDRIRERGGQQAKLVRAAHRMDADQVWPFEAYLSQVDPEDAQNAAPNAGPASPAETLEAQAQQALAQGRLDAAAQFLDQAARLKPDRYQPELLRARLARARKDLNGCVEAARRAEKLGAPAAPNMAVAAGALLDAGQFLAARTNLESLLTLPGAGQDQRMALLWALHAEVLAATEDRIGALHSIRIALNLDGGKVEIQQARARAMSRAGGLPGFQEAVAALAVRSMLTPEDPVAYRELSEMQLRLAGILKDLKQEEDTLEYRQRARRSAHVACLFAPQDPLSRLSLARAWLALGDPDGARAALKEARALGGEGLAVPEELKALEPK